MNTNVIEFKRNGVKPGNTSAIKNVTTEVLWFWISAATSRSSRKKNCGNESKKTKRKTLEV